VCCSVLQCVAVCCSVLPCGAVCVAVCCRMLFLLETNETVSRMVQCVAACCSVLQRVAVCCSVLQCVDSVGDE